MIPQFRWIRQIYSEPGPGEWEPAKVFINGGVLVDGSECILLTIGCEEHMKGTIRCDSGQCFWHHGDAPVYEIGRTIELV